MPGTMVLNHNERPAQISPAIYSPAVQRSAVRCLTGRCRALSCAALLCHAALCVLSNIQQYQVYACVLFFLLFLISLGPHVFTPTRITPVHCTADQNVTPPTSTQHSTAQGNLLCTSSSWRYQFAVHTKSWASSFCPLYMF